MAREVNSSGVDGPAAVLSYAGAVSQRVSLVNGRSFPVAKCDRIVIGPKADSKEKFATSSATRDAVRKSINPSQLGLRVKNMRFGKDSSVILETDGKNGDALSSCDALANAGLELKDNAKLRPRIIIHDLPVKLTGDDIVSDLIKLNVSDAKTDDFKVIYLYPAREKKYRSIVLETSAELRSRLLSRERVFVAWSSCRLNDHVAINQCFNCCSFSHLAADCKDKAVCGYCAGEHRSKECKATKNAKCTNCITAKMGNVAHAATDRSKCPLLRRRIERKISTIDYGR